MADNLDEQLQQYQDVWKDIKNRTFTTNLPAIDIKQSLQDFKQELQESFADTSNNAGKTIANHLDTIHKVIKQMHVLRDIMYITGDKFTLTRKVKTWDETSD